MELIRDGVAIEWVALGEGLNGEYNPDDPEDIELLRFYVHKNVDGEWFEVDDASYCTLFPVSASDKDKKKALELLMDRLYEPVMNGQSVKRLCEKLSWISPEWVEEV